MEVAFQIPDDLGEKLMSRWEDLPRSALEALAGGVAEELRHPGAGPLIQRWIADPPGWLETRGVPEVIDPALRLLHRGEREEPSGSRSKNAPTCCSSTNVEVGR